MASVLIKGLANFNSTALLVGLCKTPRKRHNVAIMQIAGITGRELRQNRPPKPPPYDYKHKKTTPWTYFTDPMLERFDDNTKIVIIEGMPTVGKDKIAKQLAEDLEMKYIPPPNFDDLWINPYGFDLRSLNHKFPANAQFYDFSTFLKNPKHINVAAMQLAMLFLRCNQYVDALAHLFSTGEGVVMQRSPWTDHIFMEAMAARGFVSKEALDYHRCAVKGTLHDFLKPHLTIYLDAPVSVIKENIKKRNRLHEVDSPALTDEYLTDLESRYKEYLRTVTTSGNLLIYDWSTEGDVGVVVEDIERLDFEAVDRNDTRFRDWKFDPEWDIHQKRYEYTMTKSRLLAPLIIARFDVPELYLTGQEDELWDNIMDHVETERYNPGFVPGFDKGILFKSKATFEDFLPRSKVPKEK
ncbi:NADH dehydrogenase [ubiquinone] 1 alpha subcomplex subunit 10, mitochondrial [Venturia canescens]|uniref:NADH dehydrogenase [ubiquinone] 1 alpha subcomplex subunit 10, mitochondrial n=1 Tax=Venturia canescens TaxID=32260 RepID=UPI001C9CE42B|nr:NADH dehydrogenase [ubiquinone] 1 alpha subcomplex subunit 10, mitochondrial [Venturia canescens]